MKITHTTDDESKNLHVKHMKMIEGASIFSGWKNQISVSIATFKYLKTLDFASCMVPLQADAPARAIP